VERTFRITRVISLHCCERRYKEGRASEGRAPLWRLVRRLLLACPYRYGLFGLEGNPGRVYPCDMASELTAIASGGLDAWRQGDFETLERILDPGGEWFWFEPGEWDCHNRDDVMRVLRERYEQGFAKGRLEFLDGGQDALIVVAHPSEIGGAEWPAEVATVMRFRDGKVVSMQDYPTVADAREALPAS
jgi:ketosteroid isomerase-like protein